MTITIGSKVKFIYEIADDPNKPAILTVKKFDEDTSKGWVEDDNGNGWAFSEYEVVEVKGDNDD